MNRKDEELAAAIGQRIAAARRRRGMKARELAKVVGVDSKMLSKWEVGNCNPCAKNIIRLCKVLGVSADWLLGFSAVMCPQDEIEAAARYAENLARCVRRVWKEKENA